MFELININILAESLVSTRHLIHESCDNNDDKNNVPHERQKLSRLIETPVWRRHLWVQGSESSGPLSISKGEEGKSVTWLRVAEGAILGPFELQAVCTLALGTSDDTEINTFVHILQMMGHEPQCLWLLWNLCQLCLIKNARCNVILMTSIVFEASLRRSSISLHI